MISQEDTSDVGKQRMRLHALQIHHQPGILQGGGGGCWLKLPAWIIGDRGFEPRFNIQVSKKQTVSSPLTHKY